MNEKVEQLIHKLDTLLGVDSLELSVSPALGKSGSNFVQPDPIIISESLDINKLDQNQLTLTHTLLHQFYGTGSKNLTKEVIEKLHDKVKEKITHTYFDRLDKVIKNDK